MPRDFESLYRAQAQAKTSTVQGETLSLPPGYLVGYDVRLRQDYTVVITAGAANVGGRLVQIKEDHQLADADWVAPKINSTRHYYIYLSKAGQWFVDIVEPKWNNEFLYYEQPDTNWRAVGKIFLADGQIIFGIKEVEKNEQTVTVAPDGFTGRADYYCTGTDDQILINAALRYLHEAYSGGECHLFRGEFAIGQYIEASYNNITISGEGIGTVLSISVPNGSYGIKIYGTASVDIENVKILGINIYNANPSTSVTNFNVYFYYTKNCIIQDCYINTVTYGITMWYSHNGIVSNNNFSSNLSTNTAFTLFLNIGYSDTINVNKNIIHDTVCQYGITGISVNTATELIITDNTIRDLSTTYDGFINTYGIYFVASASDRCIISNNNIRNLSGGTGGSIAIGLLVCGSNGKVTGNMCYNNGSDTGIAVTNGHNFNDAGTDTQVYSNSWQQPVAGEPTQGELKWLPLATNTISGYLLQNVTTTAAWSSVSIGSLVPVGTKTILAAVGIYASSSAAGRFAHHVSFSNETSSTPSFGTHHPCVQVGNYASGAGELLSVWTNLYIPITIDRKFYHYAISRTNASLCVVYLSLQGYST